MKCIVSCIDLSLGKLRGSDSTRRFPLEIPKNSLFQCLFTLQTMWIPNILIFKILFGGWCLFLPNVISWYMKYGSFMFKILFGGSGKARGSPIQKTDLYIGFNFLNGTFQLQICAVKVVFRRKSCPGDRKSHSSIHWGLIAKKKNCMCLNFCNLSPEF